MASRCVRIGTTHCTKLRQRPRHSPRSPAHLRTHVEGCARYDMRLSHSLLLARLGARPLVRKASDSHMASDNRGYPRDPNDPRRRLSPSAARNKGPILDVISEYLKRPRSSLDSSARPVQPLRILEIASGTGEHIAHYATALPHTCWQPSEWIGHASLEHEAQDFKDICESISAWTEGLQNVLPPIMLDAAAPRWPASVESDELQFEAVLAANVAHIAPINVLEGLLAGSSRVLRPGGFLFLYGPFAVAGEELSDGNLAFDRNLKNVNAQWGLREMSEVEAAADLVGLNLVAVEEMPANNKTLVFTRLYVAPRT